MPSAVRILFLVGVGLILLSGALYLGSKLGLPLGRLPGDINIRSDNFTCVFPLATSLLLSILLTIVLNLVIRFLNK